MEPASRKAADLPRQTKEKVRRAASGVAYNAEDGFQRCLVVFDEDRWAHFARLGSGVFEPLDRAIKLSTVDGALDAEGAATDGRYYYVICSGNEKNEGWYADA